MRCYRHSFPALRAKQHHQLNPDWLLKYSDTIDSEDVEILLSPCPHFSLSINNKTISVWNLSSEVEQAIHDGFDDVNPQSIICERNKIFTNRSNR